jgi:hypothetical protein
MASLELMVRVFAEISAHSNDMLWRGMRIQILSSNKDSSGGFLFVLSCGLVATRNESSCAFCLFCGVLQLLR